MDLGLKETALVTGSTAASGLHTVRALASEGAHVTGMPDGSTRRPAWTG